MKSTLRQRIYGWLMNVWIGVTYSPGKEVRVGFFSVVCLDHRAGTLRWSWYWVPRWLAPTLNRLGGYE